METATATEARFTARNLHKVMRDHGRRSDWVASQVGIHPSLMSHIARGRRSVDAGRAEAIAKALGVTIESIFATDEREDAA